MSQTLSLFCSNDHQQTTAALFAQHTLRASASIDNKHASAELIPTIDVLLTQQNVQLADLAFFAVNVGPAPFTTLRTVIATVNGLAFVTKKPVVSIDLFSLFFAQLTEQFPRTDGHYAVVQNAFCNDVYYAFFDITTHETLRGVAPSQIVAERLNAFKPSLVTIAGNASIATNSCLSSPEAAFAGDLIWERWQSKQVAPLATPLYLKDPVLYTPA